MRAPMCLLALILAAPTTAAPPPPAPASEAGKPKEREYSYTWDITEHSLVRPLTRVLDAPRLIRQVTHNPRQAVNVDERDQVQLPSTWWQPRLGFKPVTVEQMLRGPGGTTGPVPGRWTVVKAKTQGISPGLQIKDSKGDRFLLKFDTPKYPEMATGSDAIGSLLFWAAGYNVPENTIAIFRPESLDIDPKTTFKDARGHAQPFTQQHLLEMLSRVAERRDGSYRCVASRFIPGKPLGPFKYYGRRVDDPEDLVPHELRRELRGLWTIAAWTNHADIRGPNSLDSWVTDGGRSFVRHYLIDFGSILGSSATRPHDYATGTEYYLDANVMGRELATVGLVPFAWESYVDPQIPAVGFVEGDRFEPRSWRPDFPNPAFDERTLRDIRWGARIVAAFDDDHIRAAVRAAQYTDPRATEYLTNVLIQRRDKLARQWLGPVAPPAGRTP